MTSVYNLPNSVEIVLIVFRTLSSLPGTPRNQNGTSSRTGVT